MRKGFSFSQSRSACKPSRLSVRPGTIPLPLRISAEENQRLRLTVTVPTRYSTTTICTTPKPKFLLWRYIKPLIYRCFSSKRGEKVASCWVQPDKKLAMGPTG